MNYSAADLLDKLMGPNRNMAPGEQPKEFLQWSDKSVCKFYLCGFCPYELFTNTKADLGNCPNIHEESLKQQYEQSPQYGQLGYEESFLQFIAKILNDCERKIARGYERLKNRKPVFHDPADSESYDKLNEKIKANLKKVEEMGMKGMVEEAAYAMQNVEDLKCELTMTIQRANTNARLGYDREMEVCAVCGSLTLVNDLPARFEDHLNGRQHMGYARIRYQVKHMNEAQYWKKKESESKDEEEEEEEEEEVVEKEVKKVSPKRERKNYSDNRRRRSRSRSPRRYRQKSRSRSPRKNHRSSHDGRRHR